MQHRRFFIPLAVVTLGTLPGAGAPHAAAAQNGVAAPITIPLYIGEAQNVRLGSWGSGKAENATDVVLTGSRSIKVTTQGLYQGAQISLTPPADLAPAFANPNTYLRFQMRFTGTGSTRSVYDPSTSQTRSASASPFDRMRFLVTMSDGTRHELVRPIEVQGTDDPDAWVSIAFPVRALLAGPRAATPAATGPRPGAEAPAARPAVAPAALPTGDAARLAQIAIFGDKYQQFYIGEISVITDETDINVVPLEEQIAFANDQLTFTGIGEGGASTLRYSWDFDARDGIQEDRTGRIVQHTWRKPGQYKVTLTVSDVDGLKQPESASVTIDVAE